MNLETETQFSISVFDYHLHAVKVRTSFSVKLMYGKRTLVSNLLPPYGTPVSLILAKPKTSIPAL
jgi:hypothetical protein